MTELPDLIAVLSVRRGAISRVMYNLSEWTTTPAELATGGRAVRLDAYRQPSNTLEVLDAKGNKIVLLVVPVHTDSDQAHAMVMAAAASGNVSSVDTPAHDQRERQGKPHEEGRRTGALGFARQSQTAEKSGSTPDPAAGFSGVFPVWQRAPTGPQVRDKATVTSDDPVLKAFSDFGFDDMPAEAAVS